MKVEEVRARIKDRANKRPDKNTAKPRLFRQHSGRDKKYLAGEWKKKKFDEEVKRPEKRKRFCEMKEGYEVPLRVPFANSRSSLISVVAV